MMMQAVFLLFWRVKRTPSYQALQLLRTASDTASSGLIGSSMIRKSPPRPVSVPPTDVAMRKPRLVVANSVTAFLLAEMRVPGRAWLELAVRPREGGGSEYRQRAVFFPRGLAGRLYWFAILPFHGIVFNGMANRIVYEAEHPKAATSLTRPSPEPVDPAPASRPQPASSR